MAERGWFERWGLLAGPAFGAVFVVGFIVSGSSPDPDATNAKIAKYLADKSNYDKQVASFLIVLLAALLLVVFYAALRARLREAEGGVGRLSALAAIAGAASVTLFTTGILLFGVAAIAAHDAVHHGARIDPGIYRLTQDLGYEFWVCSAVFGALVAWSTWGIGRRTATQPGWFTWFSFVVGLLCLVAIFFIPILLYCLWIVVAGIVLFVRPVQPAAAAVP
jgi:hypothetical protein